LLPNVIKTVGGSGSVTVDLTHWHSTFFLSFRFSLSRFVTIIITLFFHSLYLMIEVLCCIEWKKCFNVVSSIVIIFQLYILCIFQLLSLHFYVSCFMCLSQVEYISSFLFVSCFLLFMIFFVSLVFLNWCSCASFTKFHNNLILDKLLIFHPDKLFYYWFCFKLQNFKK
jgi:hypothetical protein